MHDEGALQRQAGQRLGHAACGGLVVCADHMEGRLGRIGQRSQDVEHRAHAHRGAHRGDGLHRGVVVRREQEGEAGGGQALRGAFFIQRQCKAQRLEHIRAAGLARHRTVAVLDHRQARGRGQQRRTGGKVEAAGAIATGADDVHRIHAALDARTARQRAHAHGKAAQFHGRHALGADRRQQCTAQRRRQRFIGEADQQLARLIGGKCTLIEHGIEPGAHLYRVGGHLASSYSLRSGAVSFRKLPISCGPSGVSTLSGWNCTPSMVYLR